VLWWDTKFRRTSLRAYKIAILPRFLSVCTYCIPSYTIEQVTDGCADGDMATLITTVQQIMTGLQTADIEHDSFAVIMEAVYELAMQK